MDTKTTVTIPQRFLTSLPISFVLTLLIIYLLHLFGEWETIGAEVDWFAPENKGRLTVQAKLDAFWNSCAVLDASHHVKLDESTLDWKQYKGTFNNVKVSSSFTNTFDGHWGVIVLFTLIATFIVYFFRGLKFKIGK